MPAPEIVPAETVALPAVVDYENIPNTSIVSADDPAEFVAKTSKIATELARVVEKQKLYSQIQNKKYVHVEGWTFLGSMMGAFGQAIFAVEDWTREYTDPETKKVIGWEARVVAKTLDGREVGAAEAMCTRKEARWSSAADYAIRSMAQTRATSKALRQPLGFVMQLAGFAATPKEEMDDVEARKVTTVKAATKEAPVAEKKASAATVKMLRAALTKVTGDGTPGWTEPEVVVQANKGFAISISKLEELTERQANDIFDAMAEYANYDPRNKT